MKTLVLREDLVAIKKFEKKNAVTSGIILSSQETSFNYGEVKLVNSDVDSDSELSYKGKKVYYQKEIGTITWQGETLDIVVVDDIIATELGSETLN